MNKPDYTAAGYWLLLFVLVLAIYLPGLGNDLIFDDGILADRSIFERYGSLLELRERMLSYGSFVWVEAVVGEGWWKQRLVNVAVHLGVVVALYAFFSRLVRHVRVAGDAEQVAGSGLAALRFGIALFALNPVAVYAVAYLIQRSILLATLFSLLACIAFLRGLESGRWPWFVAALLAYLCAMLSKEHAVMVAAMAVPLFVFVRRPGWRTIAMVVGGSAGVLALVVFALLSVYENVVGQVFDEASRAYAVQIDALQPGAGERLLGLSMLNQAALFFYYGFLWFIPNVLAMSVDMRPAFPLSFLSFPEILAAAAYVTLLLGSAWVVLRRSDMLGFAALCLLFPLLLFATEFSTVWIQDPFVLYRSYLWAIAIPGIVYVLLLGVRPYPLYLIGFVVAALFAGLALERNLSLRDVYRAWSDAADKVDLAAPANAVGRSRAFVNRGSYFLEHRMTDQAYRDFARAIELGESEGSAHFNLGVTLQLMKDHDKALRALDIALAQGFNRSGLHYHRGESLYALGRFDEATDAFTQSLRRRNQDPAVVANTRMRRGEAAVAARRFDLAVEDFEALREQDGRDVRVLMGLGMAYVGAQDGRKALAIFDALLEHRQADEFYYGRAMALMLNGERDAALAAIDHAIRLEPSSPVYRQLREQILR